MRGKPRRFPNMFLNKGITPADAGKTPIDCIADCFL